MAKDIAKEALEEAKKVKASAMSNARKAMAEAFTPLVRDKVTQALNEELGGAGEPPADYDEAGEQERMGDEVAVVGDTGEDLSDEGDGAAVVEAGVEEGSFYEEDDFEEDDFEDDDLEDYEGDDDDDLEDLDDGAYMEMGDPIGDEDLGLDDEEEDDVIEVVEAEHEDEDEDEDEDMEEQVAEAKKSIRALTTANRKLAVENAKLAKVVSRLKDTLEEVNLFNTKLKASMSLFKNVALTNEEKEKVIDRFDECDNVAEIKRTYSVMKEAYNYSNKKTKRNRVSRPNTQKTRTINENDQTVSRMTELAGLL